MLKYGERMNVHTDRRALAALALLVSAAPAAAQGSFHRLGGISGIGDGSSTAYAVSADGTTVVGGGGSSEPGSIRAWRWRADTGMVSLGTLPPGSGIRSIGYGVSADGSVVAGHLSDHNGYFEAFRWTEGTGMVNLGDLPGGITHGRAFGVSGDGSVVVGFGHDSEDGHAFRWTQGSGMVSLGGYADAEISTFSLANAISTDGSTIVGTAIHPIPPNGRFVNEAFRWTQSGGMQPLGIGGVPHSLYSEATAVNADGSVVVGEVRVAIPNFTVHQAFRWTEQEGMQLLGPVDQPTLRIAVGVSGDGSVVVGRGGGGWVWTEETGMVSIYTVFQQVGIDWQAQGFLSLGTIAGISADGRTIVGTGVGLEGWDVGWVATVPAPGTVPVLCLGLLGFRRNRGRARRPRNGRDFVYVIGTRPERPPAGVARRRTTGDGHRRHVRQRLRYTGVP